MRRTALALVFATVGVSAAIGQQRSDDPASAVPRFDLSLGYTHMNANAPPGQSDYFGLNGGYISGSVHLADWISIAAEVTGGHANDISLLGQNLTLMTYEAGPRISWSEHRFVPYGQVLFGGAHASDSYFPTETSFTTSASSWALTTGGGLDFNLTRRFAVRILDVDYLRTALPNGDNNAQNHLVTSAGIVIKFGEHDSPSTPVRMAVDRPSEIVFTCGTNVASVDEGQPLEIIGHSRTKPESLAVNYTWSPSGGKIEGSGRRVIVNTTGLLVGDYHINGTATLATNSSITAQCDAEFHITARSVPAPVAAEVTSSQASGQAKKEADFHENVQDALFDYDSAAIRADAQVAILHAAQYLKDNPSIRVQVGGYADERGSAEYNLGLGEERANTARNALIAAGVDPDRIEVISFGKETQICTAATEVCWQQNRRAAFSMHP